MTTSKGGVMQFLSSKLNAEPELMMSLDNTPMIGLLLALIMMLLMNLPPNRHIVDYGQLLVCRSFMPIPEVVNVEIDADGKLYWNGQTLPHAQLDQYFRQLASRTENSHEVYVSATAGTPYHQVMTVLASAQRQGVTNLGVVGKALLF
ncbi:ExbD/TolR family protein [Undibacterium pigrum]|nr:biopolymer transporter ExbD [Undibacterium pigrum]